MRTVLKTAVILIVMALVPIRAIADVTVDLCPGHQQSSTHDASDHDHGAGGQSGSSHHDQHGNPGGDHCASGSSAAGADRVPLIAPVSEPRLAGGQHVHADFVPCILDRPPLPL